MSCKYTNKLGEKMCKMSPTHTHTPSPHTHINPSPHTSHTHTHTAPSPHTHTHTHTPDETRMPYKKRDGRGTGGHHVAEKSITVALGRVT